LISGPRAHRLGDTLNVDVDLRSAVGGAANLQLRLSKTSTGTGTRFDTTSLQLPRASLRHRLLHRRVRVPTTFAEGDYFVIACLTAGRGAAARPSAASCLASRTPVHLRGRRR
jgi:hypothetical protein